MNRRGLLTPREIEKWAKEIRKEEHSILFTLRLLATIDAYRAALKPFAEVARFLLPEDNLTMARVEFYDENNSNLRVFGSDMPSRVFKDAKSLHYDVEEGK